MTSGTTGPPKQFPISYDSLSIGLDLQMMAMLDDAQADAMAPTLHYMPIGNISGLYSNLPSLLKGQRMILLDRFNIDDWRDYVRRFRPILFGMPPSAIQMLLDADVPADELSSIRGMTTGAATVDPTAQRAFQAKYGIPLLSGYGATEFCGPVARMTPALFEQYGEAKLRSVGLPIAGVKLRIVDPDTGAELPANTQGLLEVVSPRVGPDWIRTSDLCVIDDDGFLFIRGRVDGAIMRGGFKVLPELIEQALLQHDALSAVSVVGVPDRRLGQVPAAAVVLKPGATVPSPAELDAHLRDRVLATYIPAHWLFLDDLPKTPSYKVDRQGVAAMFAEAQSD